MLPADLAQHAYCCGGSWQDGFRLSVNISLFCKEKEETLMKKKIILGFISIAVTIVLWSFIGLNVLRPEALAGDERMPIHPFSALASRTVQFIGTFYPLDQKEKIPQLNAFTVRVKNKQWLFSIEKAVDLFGGMDQSEVLENIWPQEIIFQGTADVIDPLTRQDIGGKKYGIEGIMSFSDRTLLVRSVAPVMSNKGEKGKH